jgi:hypothetical protein
VFCIDVAKVDRDVAHVARVFSSVCPKCFICFRRMLQLFHLDVAKVEYFKCFRCFIRMLQLFYLDVAYVLQWLQTCFPGVLDECCKCFNCFGRILQVCHRCCKSGFWCCKCYSGTHMQ